MQLPVREDESQGDWPAPGRLVPDHAEDGDPRGWGITYAQTNQGQSDGGQTLGAGGWNTINYQSPAFGEPGNILSQGLSWDKNVLFAVNNDPGIRPSLGQVDNPSAYIHPDAGKMPKMTQWSVGVQREVIKDLVVDAAYVGNRGTGFLANNLLALNAISEDRLKSFGLDLHNAADQALLRARLDSAAAAARGFNKLPYSTYSGANTVAQSLRPFAQFGTLTNFGVPLGMSWYDALQVKATKRYSHGLNLTYTFTWQKEENNFSGANYNVFKSPESQKAIAANSEPLVSVLAFNYIVPGAGDGGLMKAVDQRLDGRRHRALCERPADSRSRVAESAQRADVPDHAHESCARRAAVPEGPQRID